jgi:glycerophosphoryl diester phosphodiesterase
MTKIIGHRGAAGLALENTLSSFRLARELGVDAIEFDVQRTKDGQFVVCHDNLLIRVANVSTAIDEITYEELQTISLHNGEHVPRLTDVLEVAGNTPVIIEIKVRGFTEDICKIVDQYPHLQATFASFKIDVVAECRKLRPAIPAFVAEGHQPFSVIHTAKAMHANGLDLNYRLLNPLTYWLCRRANLQLMVYTVNNRLAVYIIKKLYPTIWICTDQPQRFVATQNDYHHTKLRRHARHI